MCGGSKGQQRTQQTTTTQATPEAMAAYQNILSRAQQVAETPYQAYTGERVAGFTPYQEQAFQQIAGAQQAGMGTLGTAEQMARTGAAPISAAQIQSAMNPYQQAVVQSTMDEMMRQEAMQQSALKGQAISAGAFGGDRAGVAAAELARNQEQVRAKTLASLMQQGYSQAVAQAQADRTASQVGAGQTAALAQQEQAMPLAATQALLGAGTAQQQLAQQQLNVPYQTYLEQRAYPFQTAQWLAGLATGVGGAMGGTSQSQGVQTPPQPNPLNAILGLGLGVAGLGVAAPAGAAAGTSGGTLGGNFLANLPNPFKADGGRVDDKTIDGTAVEIPKKADGGGLGLPAPSGMPYGGGFIPAATLQARPLQIAQAPLQWAKEPENPAKQFIGQAMDLAKSIRDNRKTEMPSAASWEQGTTVTPAATGGRIHMADGGMPGVSDDESQIASPRMTPAQISGFRRSIASQEFENERNAIAQRKAAQEATAQAAASQFSGDVGRMDPTAFAQKYDPLRSYLSPEQVAVLNEKSQQAFAANPPSNLKTQEQTVPAQPSAGISTPVQPSATAEVSPLTPLEREEVPGFGQAYVPPETPQQPPEPMRAGLKGVPPPSAPQGGGFSLSPEASQALMQAGFALMASRSPWLGQAIGEAGMTGTQAYAEAQKLAEARRKQMEAESIAREKLERGKWKETGYTDKATNRPIIRNEVTGETKLLELPAGVGEVVAPKTAGEAAAEKAEAQAEAKTKAAAKASLPGMENTVDRVVRLIDEQLKTGEYKGVVGVEGNIPTILPGSHDIEEKLRQISGGAFLQAYDALRGAGAITEREGAAATAALTRLKNLRQSDEGYRQALEDFRREVQNLQNVLRTKAGLKPLPITYPTTTQPSNIAVAPQPSAMPEELPPLEQREVGKTYPTPRGPMKWTGTGWINP